MRNRNLILTGTVLVLLTLVSPLFAQQGTRPNPTGGMPPSNGMQPPPQMQVETAADGVPFGPIMHCLRILDLSQEQKDAIKAAVEAEAPKLKALHETLRADREALKALVDATTQDPCAIGTAFLKVRTDEEAIRTELQAFRTTIEGILTAEQKLVLQGCIAGGGPRP